MPHRDSRRQMQRRGPGQVPRDRCGGVSLGDVAGAPGHLGEVLSPAEQELLALFRFADLQGEIVLDDKAEVLLAAVFEMMLERARSAGGAGQET